MNTFWEIKENISTEKTNVEFQCFAHTIRFLSFWHIDFMCHMLAYWDFPNKKYRKLNYHLSWIGSLKTALLISLTLFCDTFWEITKNVSTEKIWSVIVFTTPLDSFLSATLISDVTHLCYIKSSLKTCRKLDYHFSWISSFKWVSWYLLHFLWCKFEKLSKLLLQRMLIWHFLVWTTPLDSSLWGTLIWCVIDLYYIENFPMKMQKKTKKKLSLQLNMWCIHLN